MNFRMYPEQILGVGGGGRYESGRVERRLLGELVGEVGRVELVANVGSKGRRCALGEQVGPHDPVKERMVLDLVGSVGTEAATGLLVQQLENKVLGLLGEGAGNGRLRFEYALRDLRRDVLFAFDGEGRRAGEQLVGQNSQTPPVDSLLKKIFSNFD